ncbi:hypothetical protein LGM47_36465, partial [Burkholderia cepacia]|nr:hypothetical protein [Burkholderia cepacia]
MSASVGRTHAQAVAAGAGLTLRLVSKVLFWTTFYIIIVIGGFCCSSFLEMSCSSHLEMSRLELGKLAGSPSDHGAGDAP